MNVKSLFKVLGTAAAVALLAGISTSARAGTQTFSFTAPGGFSAEAVFTTSATGLTVTLTNTGTNSVSSATDLLTALFFDMTGDPTLLPQSALLVNGSTVVNFSPQPTGGNVGGEWAYANLSVVGTPGQGISSTGFGLFGQPNFGGTDLNNNGGGAVDGLDYAIVGSNYVAGTGNGEVPTTPLIQNAVQFVLNAPQGVDLSNAVISDVVWQYGTALDVNHQFVPEPAFFQMAGFLSLGGLGLLKLRRRRKA